jgi:taurine dioxygenase
VTDARPFHVEPSGELLGARITGLDLRRPLPDPLRDALLRALARHGVLCFPGQDLSPAEQRGFSTRFGSLEVNVAAGDFHAGGLAEVMVLSNVVEDGRAIGLADAGQGWHTDMSYSATVALATVLHAREVPEENGRTLGPTRFACMRAAYAGLADDVKARIEHAVAIHDFAKFWDRMRARGGSTRAPLTDEQRRRKPPVAHPVVLVHPISGERVLYCNPGYAVRIEGLARAESDALLAALFCEQLREEYRYEHRWARGDVLVWDDLATVHDAVPDYGPHQRRVMHRCQVMADGVLPGGTAAAAA